MVKATSKGRKLRQLNPTDCAQVFRLHAEGQSFRTIANKLQITTWQVHHAIKKFREKGTFERAPGSGRRRKTSPYQDRAMVREVRNNRFITIPEIKKLSPLAHVSMSTISRRIHKSGNFRSYWAARKPFLREENIQKRLQWARAHVDKPIEYWRSVLFSDESPFVLRFNCKKRVWRGHNERYESQCVLGSIKHDVKINVWGGFSSHGVVILHRIHGNMNAIMYENILDNVMLPSKDLMGLEDPWVFQHDNDPKHTAKTVKDLLIARGVTVLEWPSQSPDLNPIENLWSILNYRCRFRRANNAEELFLCLREEWGKLDRDLLDRLISSMPARCAAVIKAHGKMIKY